MKKNPLIPTLALAGATSLAAMLTPVAAAAVTFSVNRSWSDMYYVNDASLVGTIDVPVGSYIIENGFPNPFTNVNLTLIVNGNSFTLNSAHISLIFGEAQFLVNATSSVLTFSTASPDFFTGVGGSSAVLSFVSSFSGVSYGIGSNDFSPGFESAYGVNSAAGGSCCVFNDESVYILFASVTFGIAQQVPEPLTILGTGVVLGALPVLKKEYAKRNKKKDKDT